MRDAVTAIPGVVSVSMVEDLPPGTADDRFPPFVIVGDAVNQVDTARQSRVDANYFSVLQIPLVSGRIWTEEEGRLGLPLAVVNQAFVRKYSPNRRILGRTIRLTEIVQQAVSYGAVRSPAFTGADVQVIGVTDDAVNGGLGRPVLPNIYFNINVLTVGGAPSMSFVNGWAQGISPCIRAGSFDQVPMGSGTGQLLATVAQTSIRGLATARTCVVAGLPLT